MGVQRIPTVDLGAQGPPVGVQGMGCMGISGYPGTDAAGARTALEAALEEGVTFFDTADIYGRGANEEFLAPFLRAHRDEVVLSTKFGRERPKPLDLDDKFVRNDAAYVREAVDRSLKRLDTDYIDVYSLHVRNPSIPWAESIGAMAELITQGKVRYLGLSRISGDELREAHAIHPISAVQTEWSLFDRADAETSLAAAAAELGVAVVAFSPLGRGFLTGSYVDAVKDLPDKDPRRAHPRLTGDNGVANASLLTPVRDIAAAHRASVGQVALAWVHQRAAVHGCTVVPIPGTRKASRVRENTAATRLVLEPAELNLLEPLAARVLGEGGY